MSLFFYAFSGVASLVKVLAVVSTGAFVFSTGTTVGFQRQFFCKRNTNQPLFVNALSVYSMKHTPNKSSILNSILEEKRLFFSNIELLNKDRIFISKFVSVCVSEVLHKACVFLNRAESTRFWINCDLFVSLLSQLEGIAPQ